MQGQPHSTDLPVPSPLSKKSKKHKHFAAKGPEVFLVGLSDLLTRISAYNLSSYLQLTPQPTQPSPQQSHKSKGHQGHKRKKRDSPFKGGEEKNKKQHKVLTTEAPSSLDADTIVVDTSILNKVPDPAVGTSKPTNIPTAAILEEGNPDIVLPTQTQVITYFTISFPELLGFSYKHPFALKQDDASGEQPHHVVDYTPLSTTSSPSRQCC